MQGQGVKNNDLASIHVLASQDSVLLRWYGVDTPPVMPAGESSGLFPLAHPTSSKSLVLPLFLIGSSWSTPPFPCSNSSLYRNSFPVLPAPITSGLPNWSQGSGPQTYEIGNVLVKLLQRDKTNRIYRERDLWEIVSHDYGNWKVSNIPSASWRSCWWCNPSLNLKAWEPGKPMV